MTSQKSRMFMGEGSHLGSPPKFVMRIGVCPQTTPEVCMGGRTQLYGHFHRSHEGECLQASLSYYTHGRVGNFTKDCPQAFPIHKTSLIGGQRDQRQVAQARVYALTLGEFNKDALETHEAGVITDIKPQPLLTSQSLTRSIVIRVMLFSYFRASQDVLLLCDHLSVSQSFVSIMFTRISGFWWSKCQIRFSQPYQIEKRFYDLR